jgi:hypothetical protein
MSDANLTALAKRFIERRDTKPDIRRPGRPMHKYAHRYDVVKSLSPGKPKHFDVVLIRKSGYIGSDTQQQSEIVHAWRNRLSWSKDTDSPYQSALKEAYALRDRMMRL